MTDEDEEFNRIEREAKQRMEAVSATCRTTTPEDVRKIIKPWVGLTYEDMVSLQKDLHDAKGEVVLPTTFARAIEKLLKEKNGM
jgi:hypothetical protein